MQCLNFDRKQQEVAGKSLATPGRAPSISVSGKGVTRRTSAGANSPNVVRASVHLPTSSNAVPAEVEPYLRVSQKKLATDAVQQAAWAEKKWVWTEHKDEGYIAAFIVQENGEELSLEFSDGKVFRYR